MESCVFCVMHVTRIFTCRSSHYYHPSYSGGLEFKSQSRYRVSWLKFSWLCSFIPGNCGDYKRNCTKTASFFILSKYFFDNYPITICFIWSSGLHISRGGDSEVCCLAEVTQYNLMEVCRHLRKFSCLPNQDRSSIHYHQTIRGHRRCVVRAK